MDKGILEYALKLWVARRNFRGGGRN